ncbi:hypothetical protein NECAME_06526 [Necator americanus]|uniref:glucuronosyltransferase n=1 Tax=Necator americanus TaxID=51031 RepID=W2TVR2_NECAM|nr:hypothetical protein NECAME_06526 [Necator americanus]ETN85137.1 hypothetical protein NECAME_06526 [Necator americanus]
MIDFPRVITSKFKYIGGLRMPKPKRLCQEWDSVFASAKRGIILMSFGTMARSTEMGIQRRDAFVRAFKAFPDITFIWRYENSSDYFTDASNIILYNWLPQVDMLNDERTLAFITHGGMGGVFESARAGVPSTVKVITIPLFADQLRNARMMEYRGIDKDDVTENRLITAIEEILKPRYVQAAKRLSEQLRNKPFSPEEVLIRYVDYAIRYNISETLTNIAPHQSFIEYYMLDIIVPFLVVSLLVAILTLRLVYSIISMILKLFPRVNTIKTKQQ